MNSRYSDGLRAGQLGFDSLQGQVIFLFSTESIPILGLNQTLTQWVPGDFSSGVKRPEGEVDHTPPSSVEVKVVGAIFPRSWRGT
jgi:hypothetical protein